MNNSASPNTSVRKKVIQTTSKNANPSVLNFSSESPIVASKPLQSTLTSFFERKEKEDLPSVPIDVQREPTKVAKRGRGRPRKVPLPQKKMKTSSEQQIEVMEIEADNDAEEEKNQESEGKMGTYYSKPTLKAKLDVLNQYDSYLENPPLDENGKPLTLNDLYRRIASQTRNVITFSTAKSLVNKYKKNKNFKLQLENECSTTRGALSTKQLVKRPTRLTYPQHIDEELFDWYSWTQEIGILADRALIKEQALEVISDYNPNFRASDMWLDCFFERHNLSTRALNDKSNRQTQHLESLANKFVEAMKKTIKDYKIKQEYIVNFDETPVFWEYLPRKVVVPKMSSRAKGWKRGYHHARSTLALAASASGILLRPMLILKRVTPYYLNCENDIDLLVSNSKNGWNNETLMLQWLQRIFLPYVGENECLLMFDSYEGHKTSTILEFLKGYKNVHIGIIPGGTTDKIQPLDIHINSCFKALCKKESIRSTNRLLRALDDMSAFELKKQTVSDNLIKSNLLISF